MSSLSLRIGNSIGLILIANDPERGSLSADAVVSFRGLDESCMPICLQRTREPHR